MDRQVFREKLRQDLEEDLKAHINKYIKECFENYAQLLRYFSAIDRKYEKEELIKLGLPGVLNNFEETLAANENRNILDDYLSAVDRLANGFPEETTWQQKDERFSSLQDDSIWINLGKAGKKFFHGFLRFGYNIVQSVKHILGGKKRTYPKWEQQIPLRRAITYYCLEGKRIIEWNHRLQRVKLDLIRDIEDLLVENREDVESLDLASFASHQKEKLEHIKDELLQDVEEALDARESQIIDNVEKIGTLEKRFSFFNDQRLNTRRKKIKNQFQAAQEQWQRVQQLFLERTRDVVHFFELRLEIATEINKFDAAFGDLFGDAVKAPLEIFLGDLQDAVKRIDKETVLDDLESLRDSLTDFLEERLIKSIQKLIDKRILSDKTEHLFEDLLMRVGQSPREAQLIFNVQLDKNPPLVDQKEVDWRQLVIRALREFIMNPLQPSNQQYEDFLSTILDDIYEIKDIITVNFDSALQARSGDMEGKENPSKVVGEALERILGKVNELNQQADEKWQQIDSAVTDGYEQFITSLLALLHHGDSKQLQLLNAKYTVKEKAKDWQTVLDSRWAGIEDQLMLWGRFVWKKLKKYGSDLKIFLGFKESKMKEGKRADIATYLSETDQKMRELPYIYRRLFDFNSLAETQFFEPAQGSTLLFKKAYEQWQNNFPANFSVVGEKGSGKSSFLKLMLESELEQVNVETVEFLKTIWKEEQLLEKITPALDVDTPQSIEELIAIVNNTDERRVIVLESIQNCFVRDINGFAAIEKLAYFISETRGNIFWIVSCSRYAWYFLDEVMQISEYFSHISKSDSLDAQQVKRVILNRHQASGYSLYFEPDDQMLQSRTYRKLKGEEEEAQEYLKNEYFENLTRLAEGNPSIAMIFWIRSIRDFDETNFYIQPMEVTSVDMIEDLNPQVLFVLAAFVVHDALLDEELATVMNIRLEESRLLINRLRSRGMLVEKNESYTINHLMYRQIVWVLKDRNIIHLG